MNNIDFANLVTDSDIGSTDNVEVNQGIIIDVRDYSTIVFYVSFTLNTSEGSLLEILPTNENGSVLYKLPQLSDYQQSLTEDNNIAIPFNVAGYSYLRIRTKATTIGTSPALITIHYSLNNIQ